jgi:hypothetical protein
MQTFGNSAPSLLERRSGEDRRRRPKWSPLFTGFGRRRKWGRRSSDPAGYVDIYDWRTWAVALSVLILSCLDAILTSLQISAGRAKEINPLMALLIRSGGSNIFFALKIAFTSLALAVIVLHKDFRIGRLAARFSLWSYILVAVYHLCLILLWPQMNGY